MKTIAHHTCKTDGGYAYVERNAPFEAKHEPKKGNYLFLGTGYYLWDFNIEYAKIYGQKKYRSNYFVVEFELNLPHNLFFDLVGNRQHLLVLLSLRQQLIDMGLYNPKDNWYLGSFIEILKELQRTVNNSKLFPYKAIRALDLYAKVEEKDKMQFVEDEKKPNFLNLNPRMIICLTEKINILLLSSKIVYEKKL